MLWLGAVGLGTRGAAGYLFGQATAEKAVAPLPLTGEQRSTNALFKAERDAVVAISTADRVVDPWTSRSYDQPAGSGSCVIHDRVGSVVTKDHVIRGRSFANVALLDGRACPAWLVGRDPGNDLVVLRIEARELPDPLPQGLSRDLPLGQTVLANGNPFGRGGADRAGGRGGVGRQLSGPHPRGSAGGEGPVRRGRGGTAGRGAPWARAAAEAGAGGGRLTLGAACGGAGFGRCRVRRQNRGQVSHPRQTRPGPARERLPPEPGHGNVGTTGVSLGQGQQGTSMHQPPPYRPRGREQADALAIVRTWLLGILAVILMGFALITMKPVVVPVALALFITLVVSPVERRIADLVPRHIRWPGILAAMLVIVSVFGLFVGAFWVGARRIASAIGAMSRRIDEAVGEADLSDWSVFGRDIEQLLTLVGDRGVDFLSATLTQVINQTAGTLLTLVITLFLTLLMLTEAPRAVLKLQAVSAEEDSSRWRSAVRQIARKLRLYLLARAAMGLLTSVLYAAWLWWCEVDLVLVWALMTFLFSFVPNIGSVISSVLPVSYAALTGDGSHPLVIFGGLVVIEQVLGNFVDPHVQGNQVSLAPIVILVAVLLFGWMWGALGAILGVPIMIAVTVGATHMAPTRPLALFLSDQSTYEGLDEVCLRGAAEPPYTI